MLPLAKNQILPFMMGPPRLNDPSHSCLMALVGAERPVPLKLSVRMDLLRIEEVDEAGELVAAGLGDDVDDGTGGVPVLGVVSGPLDLGFLDDVVVPVDHLAAGAGVGEIRAVHAVVVLPGAAAEGGPFGILGIGSEVDDHARASA